MGRVSSIYSTSSWCCCNLICILTLSFLLHNIKTPLTPGGTFALYSLLCRHANVGLLPNRQLADQALSTYVMEQPTERKSSLRVRVFLERHKSLHTALLILVLLGTCMVIGDGLLTPTISGKFFVFLNRACLSFCHFFLTIDQFPYSLLRSFWAGVINGTSPV